MATRFGTSGTDQIIGTELDDFLYGYAPGQKGLDIGNDRIFGGKGRDFIDGAGGNDFLDGGEDDDTILGGNGADQIFGGQGMDRLFGEAGNDLVDGGEGDDVIDGGAGADRLFGGKDIMPGAQALHPAQRPRLTGRAASATLPEIYGETQAHGAARRLSKVHLHARPIRP